MAETRITNTTFYANNVSNARVPLAGNVVVEAGVFNGSAYTNSSVPTLSRVGHSEDVFVQQGSTLVLTFESNVRASLFRLYGYEDSVLTYSDDGKRITMSWQPPLTMAGHSWYFGARAVTHGGSEVLFTRVHVGKTAADIKWCGVGTSTPKIQDGVDDTSLSSGDTLIVKNAIYKGADNAIQIGVNSRGIPAGMTFPSGQHVITDVNGELIVDVTKFTNIMSETPNGVTMDRELSHGDAISFHGSDTINENLTIPAISGSGGSAGDGGRLTRAIGIVGFTLQDFQSISINRSKKIYLSGLSLVSTKNYDSEIGNGDGSSISFNGAEDCIVENIMGIMNDRALFAHYPASHKCKLRNFILTQGSTALNNEGITQSFLAYGAIKPKFHNGLVLDAWEFRNGTTRTLTNTSTVDLPSVTGVDVLDITESPVLSTDGRYIDRDAGKATNARNDQCELRNVVVYNDYGTALWNSFNSGYISQLRDSIEECVFFNAKPSAAQYATNADSILSGQLMQLKNVTVGKTDILQPYYNASVLVATAPKIDGLGIINPTWNTQLSDLDTVIQASESSQGFAISFGDIAIVNEPPNASSQFKTGATTFTSITNQNAVAQGIKYITRVEPNSPMEGGNEFAQNVFRTYGRNLTFENDFNSQNPPAEFSTWYNVNWIDSLPLELMCDHRRTYQFTSVKGVTVSGNSGFAHDTCGRPDDYLMAAGTQPSNPENTPYVVDIYVRELGSGDVSVVWRPPCIKYRENINAVDVLVDGNVFAENQPPDTTEVLLSGLSSGQRTIQVKYKNNIQGDSGLSHPKTVTVS